MKNPKLITRIVGFLSTLRFGLAGFFILAGLILMGKIYEWQYGSRVADVLIFKSVWLHIAMSLVIGYLLASLVARFRWKKRDVPFVLGAFGLILVLVGFCVTLRWGVGQGSMAPSVGERVDYFLTDEPELLVFQKLRDRPEPQLVLRHPGNFIQRAPTELNQTLAAGWRKLVLKSYHPRAEKIFQVFPSDDKRFPPAVDIEIKAAGSPLRQWLVLDERGNAEVNSGPIIVFFAKSRQAAPSLTDSHVVLFQEGGKLKFVTKNEEPREVLLNRPLQGVSPEVTVMRSYPHSQPEIFFEDVAPNSKRQSTAALKVELDGQERWLELNSPQEVTFEDGSRYLLLYSLKRVDLGFGLKLRRMNIEQKSLLLQVGESLDDNELTENRPLCFGNYIFRLRGIERGIPFMSVTYDPGQKMKWTGGALMLLALIFMVVKVLKK